MTSTYILIENKITEALDSIADIEKPNIKALARDYNLPYSRLLNRYNGRAPRTHRPPANRLLSFEQEKSLCQYIEALDKLCLPPNRSMIFGAARFLLAQSHTDSTTPAPGLGEHWVKRFLKRHPEYNVRKQKTIDILRKQAHQPSHILDWFNRFKETVNKYGIQDCDIYNFDETGFRIGIGHDQWIVTRDPRRRAYVGSSNNRESLTIIEGVATDGFTIPPLYILTAKQLQERWTDEIEKDAMIATSDTGYNNDQISFQWIQHFHRSTKARTKGTHRLLLLDGFDSHCTFEFMDFCEKNNIIPFYLIPHTSHLLQPLDVGVFQAFKHHHSVAVEEATRRGCEKFTKVEFLHAITSIRKATFRVHTIKHGWEATGLLPFNPSIVLNKLREFETTPSESSNSDSMDSDTWYTPSTVRQFNRYKRKLEALEEEDEDNYDEDYIYEGLQKLYKGSIAMANTVALLQEELSQTTAASAARKRRLNGSRRVVHKGGVISADNIRKMTAIHHQIGIEEALEKLRPKWKKVMKELKRYCRDKGIYVNATKFTRNSRQ